MALKDKLMTLEDFKAVRDVDVASNSAQFAQLSADLETLADITPIPDNSDLNSYVETGLYSIEVSTYTILNYPPVNVSGSYLEVRKLTNGYIGQKLTIPGSGKIFTRGRYNNGTWIAWKQIAGSISPAQVFTDEIKTAIFNAFEHVGWEDTNSIKYYYDLYNALNGTIFKYPVPGNKYNIIAGGTESATIDEDLTRVVITNQSLATRKTVGLKYGALKLVKSATFQPIDVYPIPIPDNATGVKVTYTTVSGATVKYQFITMIVHPSSDEYYKLANYGNWLSSGETAAINRVSGSNMFGILNFDGNSANTQNFRNVQIDFS